ncbi:MAG: cell envelope integrity EipB family protein [Hyphomicrobiaceae bacterium]|nr:cell envelope integrity EipB family protein [Hyphomicrobiaceae bacterium]
MTGTTKSHGADSKAWAIRLRVARAVIAALGCAVPFAGSASAAELAPHRAVYDMTLERASTSSGIGELAGRMVYELTGSACAGYSQNMRLVTRIIDREGSAQVNDLRTASFEAPAGGKLDFDIRQFRNKELAEATEGEARRSKGGIDVRLAKPKTGALALQGDVLFPMQHSMSMLDRARAGERSFMAKLYDGSEQGARIYDTTAFIGARLSTDAVATNLPASVKGRDALAALPAWPVSMSYFDAQDGQQDAIPSYELSFRFHDNGVTSALVIDYGDFAIRGQIAELDMLPLTPCDTKTDKR